MTEGKKMSTGINVAKKEFEDLFILFPTMLRIPLRAIVNLRLEKRI
jgi:hypothetical protein